MTWKEIKARWAADSPIFFKKVQNFGVGLVSAGTAGIAIPVIPGVVFPPIIATISGYLIVAGFCVGVVSRLTCKDTPNIPKQ